MYFAFTFWFSLVLEINVYVNCAAELRYSVHINCDAYSQKNVYIYCGTDLCNSLDINYERLYS